MMFEIQTNDIRLYQEIMPGNEWRPWITPKKSVAPQDMLQVIYVWGVVLLKQGALIYVPVYP